MNIQIDKLLTSWLAENSIKSNQTPLLVDYEEPLDDLNNMGSRDLEEINSNFATDHEEGFFQKEEENDNKEDHGVDDNTEDHEEGDNMEDHEEDDNTEDHEENDGNEDQGGKEDWKEYIPEPEDGNEGLAENEEEESRRMQNFLERILRDFNKR